MDYGASQRELTMKFSGKADASFTQPLKDLSRLTTEGAQAEQKYQTILKGRIDAYHLSIRLKTDLAKAGIGAELTEEQKYQKLLKQRIQDYQTAKRLKEDLAKAGIGGQAAGSGLIQATGQIPGMGPIAGAAGPWGVATAGIAALSKMAIDKIQRDTDRYYAALSYNVRTGKAEANPVTLEEQKQERQRHYGAGLQLADKLFHFLQGQGFKTEYGEENYRKDRDSSDRAYAEFVRGGGSMTRAQFNLSRMSGRRREYRAFQAQQELQFGPREVALESVERNGKYRLEREEEQIRAEQRAARSIRDTQNRLAIQGGAARMGVINQVAGRPSYNREAEIEDKLRQIEMRRSLSETGAVGQARQRTIAEQLRVATRQEESTGSLYRGSLGKEAEMRAEHEKAINQNLGPKEIERTANLWRAAVEETKRLEQDVMAAQERTLAIRKEGEQAIRDQMQKEQEILRGNLEMVQRQQESLRRKQIQDTEHLGLAHPMEQRQILRIAQKEQRGQRITWREQQFEQQHSDIFGNVLQRRGTERGQPIMDQLRKLPVLGLQNRQKELEKQEIKIRQEIVAHVQGMDKSLTDALTKALAPEFRKIAKQFDTELKNELDRLRLERSQQGRAQFGDFPQ
ncbi:MAG TPA: hypothetical protein VH592_21100 [Gemmataceae bacterium]|jgi:hypothetical protein